MTELLFEQLKKAKAPWWVFVLTIVGAIIVALLRAKAVALKSQKSVLEYQKQKDVTKTTVTKEAQEQGRLYARIMVVNAKVARIDEALKEIDANAADAKKRIAAAKSLRDLQS